MFSVGRLFKSHVQGNRSPENHHRNVFLAKNSIPNECRKTLICQEMFFPRLFCSYNFIYVLCHIAFVTKDEFFSGNIDLKSREVDQEIGFLRDRESRIVFFESRDRESRN